MSKISRALWLLLLLTACSRTNVAYNTVGILQPGSSLVVRAGTTDVNVYKPLEGQAGNRYSIEVSTQTGASPPPAPPRMHVTGKTLTVTVQDASGLLVRVPDRVALDVSSALGSVNVTDINGTVVARADRGDVRVMVPGYAQASAGDGNVTVFMGAAAWPGTLQFRADRGDVEVWINATAHFRAHIHTSAGTIFTDFPLRGSANGNAETIEGSVGNASQGISIDVGMGNIRLLQLKPQM